MATVPVGLLAISAYVGTVLISIPASLAVYALSRRFPIRMAVIYVGLVAAGLVLAGGVAVAALVGPVVGATLVGFALAGAVVLAGFPLFIGRQLLERWTPLPRAGALEYAILGWPAALVASFAVFLAPGGLGESNVTYLSGSSAALVWTVLGLVVTLGPAVVGLGMYRLVERLV